MKSAVARLVLCWGLAFGAAGCGKLEMDSSWRTREITVDGGDTEWQGVLTYVAKGNTIVSLLNDEEFLYLRLASADRVTQAQVMRLGFTVWFDVSGGKRRTFGIHFPNGTGGGGRLFAAGEEDEEQEFGRAERMEREPKEPPPAIALGQMEIIGPGKSERHQMKDTDAQGIDLKVVQAESRLVYELKIPLVRDEAHPYGIGAQPGQPFSVAFETSLPDRGAMRNRRGDGGRMPGGPGGGMGPEGLGRGDGGMGGGMMPSGGRRRPSSGAQPQPLQLWVTVRLATGADHQP
ncbi:MAG: hypothetical protein EXS58_00885 [Candidatus Latescibacteria bacterium]|nr:hypothetical protein [Candidatus Latescibacterota bacterium]